MCSDGDPERPRVRQEGREGRKRGRSWPEPALGGRGEVRGEDLVFFLICVLY